VVLNFCATLLSRLFSSDCQPRDALQWWHQRQVSRLHDGAELIRDGILQDLFAIRRSLELAHEAHEPVSQNSLRQMEALHLRLEQVSNELSPAFVRDSLPHAVQYMLQNWQSRHPVVKLSAQLHQEQLWQPTPDSRVALTTLAELLTLIADGLGADASLEVSLKYQENTAVLTVHLCRLGNHQCQAIAQRKELSYLRQSFQLLANGDAAQAVSPSEIRWQFSWPMVNDDSHNNPNDNSID